MQENEIKIGNWFEHLPQWSYRNEELKSFLFQWEASDWYAIGECTLSLDCIRPIEVSAQILENCNYPYVLMKGCTPQAFNGKDLDNWMWLINRDSESWFFAFLHEIENPIIRFNFLHELQNAYYLLTKEELTFKP